MGCKESCTAGTENLEVMLSLVVCRCGVEPWESMAGVDWCQELRSQCGTDHHIIKNHNRRIFQPHIIVQLWMIRTAGTDFCPC